MDLFVDNALVRVSRVVAARGRSRSGALAGLELEPPVTGTVYGALLNQGRARGARRRGHAAAVQGAPKAPVLYMKPRNTLVGARVDPVVVPRGVDALEIGANAGHRDRPHGVPRRGEGSRVAVRRRLHRSSTTSACRTPATTGRRCASRRATASARSGPRMVARRRRGRPRRACGSRADRRRRVQRSEHRAACIAAGRAG